MGLMNEGPASSSHHLTLFCLFLFVWGLALFKNEAYEALIKLNGGGGG